MIKLIVGTKGTGKTKTMIAMANEAVGVTKGNVVCVEKGIQLTYNLGHKIRLVDTEQFTINGYDQYFGFITGLMAGNYDITHIFCDTVFKVCGNDMEALENFVTKLKRLIAANDTDIYLVLSCDVTDLPVALSDLIV